MGKTGYSKEEMRGQYYQGFADGVKSVKEINGNILDKFAEELKKQLNSMYNSEEQKDYAMSKAYDNAVKLIDKIALEMKGKYDESIKKDSEEDA